MKEPILEKALRNFRLSRVLPFIPKQSTLLDVGCGWEARLLLHSAPILKEGFGIDFKVDSSLNKYKNITLFQKHFDEEALPVRSESQDTVTMLAVLEHIEPSRVDFVLGEIKRVLKKDGKLLITVPTPKAKPLLEFLSFKLGIINPDEIADHKLYYSREILEQTLNRNAFQITIYRTFQFRMNSFCVATLKA